eukprot:GHVU01134623.1.p1 GENE.GHVU01134623.1~~GHVU01134623.1.p1  ORF type:complete len:114 (+),score=2.52 GHVU01134623.1:378-719(+)
MLCEMNDAEKKDFSVFHFYPPKKFDKLFLLYKQLGVVVGPNVEYLIDNVQLYVLDYTKCDWGCPGPLYRAMKKRWQSTGTDFAARCSSQMITGKKIRSAVHGFRSIPSILYHY